MALVLLLFGQEEGSSALELVLTFPDILITLSYNLPSDLTERWANAV